MTLERHKLRRSIPILNDIDSYLYEDIKRVFVFGRENDCVIFITRNDQVYSYGRNNFGHFNCGNNDNNDHDDGCTTGENNNNNNKFFNEPQKIHKLCGRKIVEFSAGRNHLLARSRNGQVYSCGSNEYGQIALSPSSSSSTDQSDELQSTVNIPHRIDSLCHENIVGIACGAFHSLALTKNGKVYGWGYNFWGQLGLGDNDNRFQPTLIKRLKKINIVEIACGQHHSVALSNNGDLYTWGHNAYGQIGIGERVNYHNIPTKVIDGKDFVIKQVTCGQNHVLAVSTDGQLLGFGSNYYGQLGTGSRRNEYSPVPICSNEKIKDILSSPFSNTSLARTKKKRNSLVFGKCGDHWLLTPIDTKIMDENEMIMKQRQQQQSLPQIQRQQSSASASRNSVILDENNNPIHISIDQTFENESYELPISSTNEPNVADMKKSKSIFKKLKNKNKDKSKTNSHEVFAEINQSTAYTTKVVKSNNRNLFWQIFYMMKNTLPMIRSNNSPNHYHHQQQQQQPSSSTITTMKMIEDKKTKTKSKSKSKSKNKSK